MGKYHITRMMSLLDNWNIMMDATDTSMHSFASSIEENIRHMTSLDSKTQKLIASTQELSIALGDSGIASLMGLSLDATTRFTKGLTELIKEGSSLSHTIEALGVGILSLTTLGLAQTISGVAMTVGAGAKLATTIRTITLEIKALTVAMATNPFTIIATVLATAIGGYILYKGHQKEVREEMKALGEQAEESAKKIEEIKKSLDVSGSTTKEDVAQFDGYLTALVQFYGKLNKLKQEQGTDVIDFGDIPTELIETAKAVGINIGAYTSYNKLLSDINAKILQQSDALRKLRNNTEDGLKTQINQTAIQNRLLGYYDESKESLEIYNKLLQDQAEGHELSADEAIELIKKVPKLKDAITEENGVITLNIDLIKQQREDEKDRFENKIKNLKLEVDEERKALASKLKLYGIEIQSLEQVAKAKGDIKDKIWSLSESFNDPTVPQNVKDEIMKQMVELTGLHNQTSDIQEALKEIDDLQGKLNAGLDTVGTTIEKESKEADNAASTADKIEDIARQTFENKKKLIEQEIDLLGRLREMQVDGSEEERSYIDKEIEARQRKIKLLQEEQKRQEQVSKIMASSSDAYVTTTSTKSSAYKGKYADIINEAGSKYGVDPKLIAAIIKQESGFNPDAKSHAGAQGLMQLMPGTARGLGVTNSYDPYQNIMGGAKYIADQLKAFGGDLQKALAAYNAGAGNVKKYGGIPPFKETQNYVKSILANYGGDKNAISFAKQSAEAEGRAIDFSGEIAKLNQEIEQLRISSLESVFQSFRNQVQESDQALEISSSRLSSYNESSDEYRTELQSQIGLLKEKQKALHGEANELRWNIKLNKERTDELNKLYVRQSKGEKLSTADLNRKAFLESTIVSPEKIKQWEDRIDELGATWWDVENSAKQASESIANSFFARQDKAISKTQTNLDHLQYKLSLLGDTDSSKKSLIFDQMNDELSTLNSKLKESIKQTLNLKAQAKSKGQDTTIYDDRIKDLTKQMQDNILAIRNNIIEESQRVFDELVKKYEDRIEEFNQRISMNEFKLELLGSDDFNKKLNITGDLIEDNKDKASQIISEFNKLAETEVYTAEDADKLRNKLYSLKDELRSTNKQTIEYVKQLEQINFDKLTHNANLAQEELDRLTKSLNDTLELLDGGLLSGTELNFDFSLPSGNELDLSDLYEDPLRDVEDIEIEIQDIRESSYSEQLKDAEKFVVEMTSTIEDGLVVQLDAEETAVKGLTQVYDELSESRNNAITQTQTLTQVIEDQAKSIDKATNSLKQQVSAMNEWTGLQKESNGKKYEQRYYNGELVWVEVGSSKKESNSDKNNKSSEEKKSQWIEDGFQNQDDWNRYNSLIQQANNDKKDAEESYFYSLRRYSTSNAEEAIKFIQDYVDGKYESNFDKAKETKASLNLEDIKWRDLEKYLPFLSELAGIQKTLDLANSIRNGNNSNGGSNSSSDKNNNDDKNNKDTTVKVPTKKELTYSDEFIDKYNPYNNFEDTEYKSKTDAIKEEIKSLTDVNAILEKQQELEKLNHHYMTDSLLDISKQREKMAKETKEKLIDELSSEDLTEETIQQYRKAIEEQNDIMNQAQKDRKRIIQEVFDYEQSLRDKSLKKFSDYQDDIQHQLNLVEKADPENYGQMIQLNQELVDSSKQYIEQLKQQSEEIKKQRDTFEVGSFEWNLLNDQVKDYSESIEDATENLSSLYNNLQRLNKDSLSKTFEDQLKLIEKQVFDGQTEKDAKEAFDRKVKLQEKYLSGAEKEIAIAQLRKYIRENELALSQEQIALLNTQGDLEQEKYDRLKKQLEIQQLEMKLSNLRNQQNIQQLKKKEDGTWDFVYVADQKAINDAEEELQNSRLEMIRWEEEVANNAEREKLEQKSQYMQEMRDITQRALNGEIETWEDFNEEITGLNNEMLDELVSATDTSWKSIFDSMSTNIASMKTAYQSYVEEMEALAARLKAAIELQEQLNKQKLEQERLKQEQEQQAQQSTSAKYIWQTDGFQNLNTQQKAIYLSEQKAKGNLDNLSQKEKQELTSVLNGTPGLVSELIKQSQKFDTGGLTGTWGNEGKLALLHEKELVLNKLDTQNILSAVNITREFMKNIKLPDFSQLFNKTQQKAEQVFHIGKLEFPNVTSSSEIQDAIRNLPRLAIMKSKQV